MSTPQAQITTEPKTLLNKILNVFGFELVRPKLTENGFTEEEEAELLRRMNAPRSEFIPIEEFLKKYNIEIEEE